MKKLLIGVAAVAGSLLATAPAAHAADLADVVVDSDASDGSVGAGAGLDDQPLVGVGADTSGRVCVGFSYQLPICTAG